jgi:hypothetical protein
MAIVAGIKIKTKAPRATRMAFADEKYTGPEPQWDSAAAEAMDQTEFDHHLRKSFYYYNYHYNQKDTKKYIVEWMQNNGYPKAQVSDFIRSPDRMLSMTACSIVMAHRAGMPMRERQMEFMREQIAEVLAQSEPEAVEAVTADRPKAYVPTIQDRLNERTSELIGELEGVFDDVSQGRLWFGGVLCSVVYCALADWVVHAVFHPFLLGYCWLCSRGIKLISLTAC